MTAPVIPRRRATTFRMKTGFRLRFAVEKKRRARSIATVTAPIVAPIMRKTSAESMTASQFVPGGGSGTMIDGLVILATTDIDEPIEVQDVGLVKWGVSARRGHTIAM